jgi:hypothetical protein
MASTSKGIVYPTSGDEIAPLESHFASLASTANTALITLNDIVDGVDDDLQAFKGEVGVIPAEGSFSFTGPTSTTTPTELTITLPSGYFSTIPVVVATVSGVSTSSPYFAVLHSVTTSQFKARIWRTIGTAADTSLKLNWIAK